MRIIIVYDTGYINGGAAKVAITEAIALAESGLDVTYFAAVGPVDECLEKSGVKVICLAEKELKEQLGNVHNKIHGAIQGLWNLRVKDHFTALLDHFRPEDTIIHFHGWSLALSPVMFFVTKKGGFKIAITCHDYEINCPEKIYYNYKAESICECKAMSFRCIWSNCDKRSRFQKLYRIIRQKILLKELSKNKLSLIYITEKEKSFIHKDLTLKAREYIVQNPVEIRPYINIDPSNNERYVYIGRISSEKGLEMFCKAVSKAGVKADVIGNGDKLNELRKTYGNVQFHGWLSSDEMSIILQMARCLVVTSVWVETGPLNVPETQCAYALPCIIPSMCGIVDSVRKNKTGLIFEIGNIDSLVSCIEKSKNDQLLKRLSENCLKIDKSKYWVKTHICRLLETYNNILQEEG